MAPEKVNLLGAWVAICIMLSACLVFVFRLYHLHKAEYYTGIVFLFMAVPLIFLLFPAIRMERPLLYFIQLGLMIVFILLEGLLDYVFKVDFRHTRWSAISYAIWFFSATGGMIGVASQAGKGWTVASVILFFILFGLTFYQRAKTGM